MNTFAIAKMIVVNSQKKFLALRRSETDTRRPLQWDLPGGRVEEGEDILAAAIRETEEESGLRTNDVKLVYGMTDDAGTHGSGTWVVFIGSGEGKVVLSREHSEFRWMDANEALEQFKYDRQLQMLKYLATHDIIT